jgi:hypothetical protein
MRATFFARPLLGVPVVFLLAIALAFGLLAGSVALAVTGSRQSPHW